MASHMKSDPTPNPPITKAPLTKNFDPPIGVKPFRPTIGSIQSSLFDMLCSLETLYDRNRAAMENWFAFNLYTYILLPEYAEFRDLEKKLPGFVDKYMGQVIKAMKGEGRFFLQPLTRIRLHSRMENEIGATGSILNVYIFSAVALFIVFIACVNFMNLATARSANRAMEVGIRKLLGAKRRLLFEQFLGESLLLASISLCFAVLLVRMSLPFFSRMSGVDLKMGFSEFPWLIPALLGLTVFVGFFAGSYPAVYLSAHEPIRVLRGKLKAGAGNPPFRSALVVVQFIISVILIIGSVGVSGQLRFMKEKPLGFDKKDILCFQIPGQENLPSVERIKSELKSVPGIMEVCSSSVIPGQNTDSKACIPEGFSEVQYELVDMMDVDHEFLPAMGIEIVKGRNFSPRYPSDRSEAVIINETAVNKF